MIFLSFFWVACSFSLYDALQDTSYDLLFYAYVYVYVSILSTGDGFYVYFYVDITQFCIRSHDIYQHFAHRFEILLSPTLSCIHPEPTLPNPRHTRDTSTARQGRRPTKQGTQGSIPLPLCLAVVILPSLCLT